ncbi:hypothetical protein GO730_26805 [Spirosoma sp. HMF3257]|uniref:hypothetical protein n=1 Tax=Spirosoma telluris TaxID=2183553 RepID=UPI0012FBCC21|nr:hypothetical protein [Spirosoma telluris]
MPGQGAGLNAGMVRGHQRKWLAKAGSLGLPIVIPFLPITTFTYPIPASELLPARPNH